MMRCGKFQRRLIRLNKPLCGLLNVRVPVKTQSLMAPAISTVSVWPPEAVVERLTAVSALPTITLRKCCAMHEWLVW